MSPFDLKASLSRATERFGPEPTQPARERRRRSDRGRPRLDPALLSELEALLSGQDRPAVRVLQARLAEWCAERGLRPPARATLYQAFDQTSAPSFAIVDLPAPVQRVLHNLSLEGSVPGHQLAFYCLNYGDLDAISFAAGLPWLALHQAGRLRGWRPRSRGLLESIRKVRGF